MEIPWSPTKNQFLKSSDTEILFQRRGVRVVNRTPVTNMLFFPMSMLLPLGPTRTLPGDPSTERPATPKLSGVKAQRCRLHPNSNLRLDPRPHGPRLAPRARSRTAARGEARSAAFGSSGRPDKTQVVGGILELMYFRCGGVYPPWN